MAGRLRRPVGGLALAALSITLLSASTGGAPSSSAASAGSSLAMPEAQPVIGVDVSTLIGSSPDEASGETWGYETGAPGFEIVRYTPQSGWQVQPAPTGPHGEALTSFKPASGPLAGRSTPEGGIAILGEVNGGGSEPNADQLLVRNPAGSFSETPTLTTKPPSSGESGKSGAGGKSTGSESETGEANALLKPGEKLFGNGENPVLMAPVQAQDGHTGAFIVPSESPTSGVQEDVLLYDGESEKWAAEPICLASSAGKKTSTPECARPESEFEVLAIDASSPQNAWLLAKGKSSDGVLLFHREGSEGEARWVQRSLGAAGSLGAEFAEGKGEFAAPGTSKTTTVKISPLANGQPLTVTSQGLWVDGQLTVEAPGQAQQTVGFTLYYNVSEGAITSSWCSLPEGALEKPAQLCSQPLKSSLPTGAYRSFAWSEGGPYGERVITGLGEGVSLILQGTSFEPMLGDGGQSGTSAGAAFSSPQEGWLAPAIGKELTHLTTSPEPDRVSSWPVPFKQPLTAIATEPGKTPGELGAQAIAVGDKGQAAHYYPGQGWVPEALLNSSMQAQVEVELRGVAWPEPGRAYAVGTNGAMWLWLSATGLWQPDPEKPPNLHLANFTGIAFEPGHPSRGYAIGQQGLLLAYGKTWEQEKLPAGLEGPEGANFTSIAFAGGEAIITFQVPNFKNGKREYVGGVLDNTGGGWQIDIEAEKALGAQWGLATEAERTHGSGAVPVRVAGLPDGGAVIAGAEGQVIERQDPGQPWQASPAGRTGGFPAALAAIREDGALHAIVSVESESLGLTHDLDADEALQQPPAQGQAPIFTTPYTQPGSGFLLRETSEGWQDEEHEAYPAPNTEHLPSGQTGVDWPVLPDSVLALALPPDGGEGWAVGGQTGEINTSTSLSGGGAPAEAIQTAGMMRYPAGTPTENFSTSPQQTSVGDAAFAIGGNAQCATACANLSEDHLGPDQWLSNALDRAAQTTGVKAFIYTGPHLAPGLTTSGGLNEFAFQSEEEHYAKLLSGAAGTSMSVYAAPTETDLNRAGSLSTFSAAMGAIAPIGTAPPETPQPAAKPYEVHGAYAVDYPGSGGTVRLIVLDYSHLTLEANQQCWLVNQLANAKYQKMPAIVIGNRSLTSGANTGAVGPNVAGDANEVINILVTGKLPDNCVFENSEYTSGQASAYFFDSPEQNRRYAISAAGEPPLETYGSGTLGYTNLPANKEFVGSSGFLLVEVELAKRDTKTNRAPVHVELTPNVSTLALRTPNGVLLQRSHPALFEALAREPQAGMECQKAVGGACAFRPGPYVEIPDQCSGEDCSTGILPEYTFTSSKPGVGQFVEPDPAEPYGTTVYQNASGKPIPAEPRNAKGELNANERFDENAKEEMLNERGEVVHQKSGLFCAYNAGTTTLTVHAGGLAYSEQVTVFPGSVEQPCGTAPLENPPPPIEEAALPSPVLPPGLPPALTPTAALPPPPPLPPHPIATTPLPTVKHSGPLPTSFAPPLPAQLYPLVPLVPPPAPAAARPTPPSGTAQVPAQSPVSQQVSVAERESEHETAIQHVHNMAYRHPEEDPLPPWTLGLILIAAAAGVGIRRGKRSPNLAYSRTSSQRDRR